MNAQVANGFSLHDKTDRNGHNLVDIIQQHNLNIGNTSFQKHVNKRWTYRVIDFIMYRKRWRNSFNDCQAYSSLDPVGSDHRIVTATVQLSLRRPKQPSVKKLFWRALTTDPVIASQIDNTIASRFNDLPTDKQDHTAFVSIANSVGSELLPSKPRPPPKTVDSDPVVTARKATLRASTRKIQTTQNNLRATFDSLEDKRINDIRKYCFACNHQECVEVS